MTVLKIVSVEKAAPVEPALPHATTPPTRTVAAGPGAVPPDLAAFTSTTAIGPGVVESVPPAAPLNLLPGLLRPAAPSEDRH